MNVRNNSYSILLRVSNRQCVEKKTLTVFHSNEKNSKKCLISIRRPPPVLLYEKKQKTGRFTIIKQFIEDKKRQETINARGLQAYWTRLSLENHRIRYKSRTGTLFLTVVTTKWYAVTVYADDKQKNLIIETTKKGKIRF